jgi:transcription elongation factor Elf1
VIVKIPKEKGEAKVTCGTCDLVWTTEKKGYEEKVDVYSRFVDAFLEGE